MLIEFSVKNFRSIKEEQTLSMVASADNELPENVFPLTRDASAAKRWKNTRLVKSAVIYGANASGKSNLLEALQYICLQVGKTGTLSIDWPFERTAESFTLDSEWKDAPSEFRISFILDDDGAVYEYYVKIHLAKGIVLEEKLDFFPKGRQKCLFQRSSNPDVKASTAVVFPGNNMKGVRGLDEQTAPDALFVSVAAAFNQPLLMRIRSQFSESVLAIESQYSKFIYHRDTAFFKNDSSVEKRMNSWLRAADFGIKHFEMKDDGDKTPVNPLQIKKLFFLHGGLSENFIEYRQESSGTQRWVKLLLVIHKALERGSLIFIDEISADLHPLLVAYFVALFHNPRFNPKNAQLICTTHHSSLLASELLRRDQIWFAEKDGEGASHYYSLLDYSPRKDKALMKGYLSGEYGAVPDLDALDSLLEKMGV